MAPRKTKPATRKKASLLVLRPSEVKRALGLLSKIKRAGFIWGPPGIGKSQILAQVASELKMKFVDIRLSQVEPTDIRGIPIPTKYTTEETDKHGQVQTIEHTDVVWAAPSFFDRNNQQPVFYLFDEMNTAPPSIQAAAYQIILDRKLGDFALRDHDVVMAAGNRDTDRGSTFKMATPLMNRFIHMEMTTNFEDWSGHAVTHRFNKDVVGFLTSMKQHLFNFNPKSASRGFPTPRSWEFVSQIINSDIESPVPENVLTALVAGAVGEGAAIEFMAYRQTAIDLPNPDDILSGKVKTLDTKEPSVTYALAISLCYCLADLESKLDTRGKDEDKWTEICNNFIYYIANNFAHEMSILAIRLSCKNFKVQFGQRVLHSKSWELFFKKYRKYIIAA